MTDVVFLECIYRALVAVTGTIVGSHLLFYCTLRLGTLGSAGHHQATRTQPAMENSNDRYASSHAPSSDEQPSSKRRRLSMPLAREVGLMRSAPGDLSGFVGSSSGIHFIRVVYGAMRAPQSIPPPLVETPGSDIVPGEDDRLPSVHPRKSELLWTADEITTATSHNFSFTELVEWSGSYFANWHCFYPFLHAPTILAYFDDISRNGIRDDGQSGTFQLLVVRSIMSISLADRRQSSIGTDTPYPTSLVFPSYDAAVDGVRYVLSRPTSLLALQAAMSVQLFLVSMLRLNAASRLGGLIIRMAVQLGLHRCPGRFPSFTASQQELRKRVFWSVYALDRFICQSMGLPLGLHDSDLDVCYPATEHHLETQYDSSKLFLLLQDLFLNVSKIAGSTF